MPLTRFKLSSIANDGITSAKIADNIHLDGTEAIRVPVGTTAQRANESSGDIRFNSTINLMEYYDGTGWKAIDSAPIITSISPTTETDANADIVITGQFFASGATVKFVGNDGTEYASPSVTFTSTSSITAQTPNTALTVANEPYDIVVTNPSGLSGTGNDLLDAGGAPTWTTSSGSLMGSATMYEGEIIESLSVAATDPDGDTVTYGVTSGDALPAGLSLNTTTGAITGDTDAVSGDTTTTFSIDATAGGDTTARSFSMVTTNDESAAYEGNLKLWLRGGWDGFTGGNMSGAAAGPAAKYQTGYGATGQVNWINSPFVSTHSGTSSPISGTTKIKDAQGGVSGLNTQAKQDDDKGYHCDSGDVFWINVPSGDSLFDSSTTNHTFMGWMFWEDRPANTGSNLFCPTFHSWGNDNGVSFIALDWHTNATSNPYVANFAGGGYYGQWDLSNVSGGSNGNKNVWYHWAMVYTSGQTLCYLNGVLDATLTGPTSWPTPNSNQKCNFHGRSDGTSGGLPTNYTSGDDGYRSQADLRYYNTNLSAGAIVDIYNKSRNTFV